MQTLDFSVFSETVVKPVLTQLVATRQTCNVKAVGTFHTTGGTIAKKPLRLFVSGTGDYARLAFYRKGSRKRGYDIDGLRMDGLFEIQVCGKRTDKKSPLDEYCDRLRKFKKAFANDCHPNLWKSLQDGYARLDVDDFKSFAEKFMAMQPENDRFHYYEALCEYRKLHNLDLMTENCYKRTTILSNKEKFDFGGERVKAIVERLKKAIEKQQDFSESWEGNYDVHVECKKSDNGYYRGWLSLEYRGCGNGHYYLLLNSNSAIFSEDD
jgi:hypothetical protein